MQSKISLRNKKISQHISLSIYFIHSQRNLWMDLKKFFSLTINSGEYILFCVKFNKS